MADKNAAPVEHVADLTCPEGHTVEVHWTEGQQATHWQCPKCLVAGWERERAAAIEENEHQPDVLHAALREAGRKAHEASLVKFGSRKNGDRQLAHDLSARTT